MGVETDFANIEDPSELFERSKIKESNTERAVPTVTNCQETENIASGGCSGNNSVSRKKRRKKYPKINIRKLKTHPQYVSKVFSGKACCFCKEGENKVCGRFFRNEEKNIAAHQFCMLFSAGLPQQGEDEEGFDGFMINDIVKEYHRASRITCRYCNQNGASAGCCIKSCRATYHFKCGVEANIQYVYQHKFDSYCSSHRSFQDLSYLQHITSTCPVCLEEIVTPDHKTVLKTPCCKNVFLHRKCVQMQATASGYFFKCPTCNNQDQFQEEMARYGIYIPQSDAVWEENDAFADLLIQYNQCDSKDCACPQGPTHFSVEEGH